MSPWFIMMKFSSVLLAYFSISFTAAIAQDRDIFEASRQGNIDLIRAYVDADVDIDAKNRSGHTPFILTAYYGHTDKLIRLIELGANPCATDNQGNLALMGVVFKGYMDTFTWLAENTKCDVNHQNYAGQTALMMAALFDRIDYAKILLAKGADPSLTDMQGNSALSLAKGQGGQEMAQMLTEAISTTTVRSENNKTYSY